MWALNCRAGANLRHLGSVCRQPTALGGNHVGFKLQGWGQLEASWVCMSATYSTWRQPCGLQGWGQLEASWVCMLATYSTWRQPCGALNCRAGANLRHLGSVCWQPTALGVGFKLQGWGQLDASWVCMLATYYCTWRQPGGLPPSAVGCQHTDPRCLKLAPALQFKAPHGCLQVQ